MPLRSVIVRTASAAGLAIAFSTTSLAPSAQAADPAPTPNVTTAKPDLAQLERKLPPDPQPWRLSATAYAWAMNVGGNVTARNQTVDTNASFIDILQKSNSIAAYMTYIEAGKGPVSFYTDFVFTSLGFGRAQTSYRNPLPGLSLTAQSNAALTYQLFIVEMGGTYELQRWAGQDSSFTALDALAGFRYWNNSVSASFDVTGNVNYAPLGLERSFGLAIARSDVVQWVDPVIGLRLRHQFTPTQSVFVRGDVGGFGVSGSQFSWQAVGAYSYGWQFTGYQIELALGFRALGVTYNSGSGISAVGINETLYGPIVGATVRF
ncbi:hypothetical protein SAMN02745126_05089 [Enhydrobacter aerosaccus]|uniref:Uncharacterized protein n=1 Tax=Enhydrobacter aerosaccus TaxID=225324 RepID=A0A1T4ST84_9HYPH|nr:hypothetical protein [Enhydrobacter aerosaccus]SKA31101.1 hypothetical protein SAMN02745126_05089 [Enhydrobacter aerosaccus]